MSSTVIATYGDYSIKVKTEASSIWTNYAIAVHELHKVGCVEATEENIKVAIY